MNKMSKLVISTALVAVAAMGLTACGEKEEPKITKSAAPKPSPTVVVETPEPTVEPTVEPTPEEVAVDPQVQSQFDALVDVADTLYHSTSDYQMDGTYGKVLNMDDSIRVTVRDAPGLGEIYLPVFLDEPYEWSASVEGTVNDSLWTVSRYSWADVPGEDYVEVHHLRDQTPTVVGYGKYAGLVWDQPHTY